MEATVLSVGKSVLHGALGYAKSALAEEVALQLGVQRDQLFITDELEMMQAFLMAAHDEPDSSQVVKVWVKQVRDAAYNVEDSLQDFAVRLDKQSWWRISRTLLDRRHVAKQMKELRASIQDVSQRNMRYHLIKGSKPGAMTSEQSRVTPAALFGIDEARRAAKMEKSKVDLVQLINKEEADLRVIAVWGTSVNLGQTSIIRAVYENSETKSQFPCRAWVRLMHPFVPKDFIQSLVNQFHAALGVNLLLETEKSTAQDLIDKFNGYLNKKKYLIVLNDLSTIEEWDQVKNFFPVNEMGSRIIVSTSQAEVASLCAGQERIVSELKQLSADENIYAFYDKGSRDGTDLTKTGSSSATTGTLPTDGTLEDQAKSIDENKGVLKKNLSRISTMLAALEESLLVGRVQEKVDIIKLITLEESHAEEDDIVEPVITNQATQRFRVISVWGMGGLGKTTLIKDMYQTQELSAKFQKRAWVTIMRPFNPEVLIRSLVMQLDRQSSGKKGVGFMGSTKNTLLPLEELTKELMRLLEKNRCLIVLDDVSSTADWDTIKRVFSGMDSASRIIVTTREENIAMHCSERQRNHVYRLKGLEYEDALKLFTKKVFGKITKLDGKYLELVEQANQILSKCSGLPLAVVTIGGFLANQPKNTLEWGKLNENISAELEMNPELGNIRTVLIKSYDGLPYHLKSCFLYMPIFPKNFKIGRRRLVCRWTAEGYSREVREKSAEEISDSYFVELISRSMILPSQRSIHSTKGVDSCQVHDLMREIGISKSIEENLVFSLDKDCSSNNRGTVRHLAINSNWEGNQAAFESMVDMSRVRSLTVFGEWKPFYISAKMSLLRVLDLEDTTGLFDRHVEHIGEFRHLRYLSLRGCENICHLPASLGNLRQLEILDVRGTKIVKLPKRIVKLQKLTCLYAGKKSTDEKPADTVPWLMRNKPCLFSFYSVLAGFFFCAPQCLWGGMTRRDVCTLFCCLAFPVIAMDLELHGVLVPRGVGKLKALHTLGVVNIGHGKSALKDIRRLIRLRKLGVTGINKRNGEKLCSAITGLRRLESLSMRSEGEPGLSGCLDGISSPPENLLSLKLYGNLVKLPMWITKLKNLVKLKLRSSKFSDATTTMEVLGNLPSLASLHLLNNSFQDRNICLTFSCGTFPSLVVLELCVLKQMDFKRGTAPNLELLKFLDTMCSTGWEVRGLPSLSNLKESVMDGEHSSDFLDIMRAELGKNKNRPILKVV